MPAVKRGESRNDYVKRAVDMLVHKEGLAPKQAVGKAEGMYDSKWGMKGSSKKGKK